MLHINNMKKFYVREDEVMRLAVVAESWEDDHDIGTKTDGVCVDFDPAQLVQIKSEFPEVFSGRTSVCRLEISTTGEQPISSPPYRRTG